jgi:hypothetical protein
MALTSSLLRWRDGLSHFIADFGRHCLVGLCYLAMSMYVVSDLADLPPQVIGSAARQVDQLISGDVPREFPPPGYPETLARNIPLSPAEQELWADLRC